MSVRSNLGDEITGHLFLTVSGTYYQQATIGNLNKPSFLNELTLPTSSNTNTVSTTRSKTSPTTANISTAHELYKVEYRTYQENLNNCLLYFNTSKCLIKKIAQAVSFLYIEELEDLILKFGKQNPFLIIKDL